MRKIYGGGIIGLFMIAEVEGEKLPVSVRGRVDLGAVLSNLGGAVVGVKDRFFRWAEGDIVTIEPGHENDDTLFPKKRASWRHA